MIMKSQYKRGQAFIAACLLNTLLLVAYYLSRISSEDHESNKDFTDITVSYDSLLSDQLRSLVDPKQTEFKRIVFQTSSDSTKSSKWKSWSEDNGFEYRLYTDQEMEEFIRNTINIDQITMAFELMSHNVLKADFFRYLVLFYYGGLYTDIDTEPLKSWEDWQSVFDDEEDKASLVVGIEADPDRIDWNDWYARRVQLCQWTILAKKGNPILQGLVMEIVKNTLELKYTHLDDAMEWTGPGIFTDAIMNNLKIDWKTLTGLKEPKLIEDVLVLPITSFSPGVGHMGSGQLFDRVALVKHFFAGSWKN
ncbi:hypothetical protein TBLA_0B00380 [Henningerozyma blattae CBS 6284]|uniref:Initiation-specific alpha-1,6-mannosyltransferase n=1 Tax=Henningerozyma blattae (strain ATCC 34711 / CBS 6284 / DSM 70876 / NBRC 10599 / NRRL Y-10934 / UCD 77-7) TaxID=1071380 RepID=I2GXN1_HENB6|nr:hypothetical protein TBLA_0B00380 [Tetrapisispora blattae CBS 6284]CCH58883.1 hypothetical protein TBLA_0B00380 [Tetrapisispora blattae CBS 6284]